MEVNRTRYSPWHTILGMPPKPSPKEPTVYEILWENCLALMIDRYGKENLNAFARDTKIGPGSASRIKAAKTDVGLGVLVKIAKAFKLQPWHLLMPDLDPANAPVAMLSDSEKELYERLKRGHAVMNEPAAVS